MVGAFPVVRAAYRGAVAQPQLVSEVVGTIDAFLEQYPDDPVALTMKGSLMVVQAGAVVVPWKKVGLVNDGLSLMDRGFAFIGQVAAQSGRDSEIEVRMIRGVTISQLVPPFRRDRSAREDLSFVLSSPLSANMEATDLKAARRCLEAVNRRLGITGD